MSIITTKTSSKKVLSTGNARPAHCTRKTQVNNVYTLSAGHTHCKILNCNLSCTPTDSLHSKLIVLDVPTSIGATIKVLLDCGSTTNFISSRLVQKYRLPSTNIARVQVVKLADGSIHNTCKIVNTLQLYIKNNTINENLLILPIDSFDVILGMPFLKKI